MDEDTREIRIEVNDQVHLSEVRPGDKSAFVEYLNEREIYDNTLLIPNPYSEKDAERYLGNVERTTTEHGYPLQFAIRDGNEQLIGGCGFDDLARGHRAEIGYWLAKPFWGQGIMTQVVRVACAHAFDQWKLVRITAHVFTFNQASARVLEKCGFQLEGVLRKNRRKAGTFLDSKLYALVK